MTQLDDRYIFKILSLGDFYQDMQDEITILNRPCIRLENEKKKWGNEYILYSKKFEQIMVGAHFYGKFRQDQKRQTYIRLTNLIDSPVSHPDYFILTLSHDGDRLDRWYDFKKAESDTWSKIFSTAYHYDDGQDKYKCQTMLLMRHGDQVTINGKTLTFDAKVGKLV